MLDFTVNKYIQLLNVLNEQRYQSQTFTEFLANPLPKSVVLSHDVDRRPRYSLTLAKMERLHGLKGVYNFRATAGSWNEEVIKEIASMGHEIGYHYDELAVHRGDLKKAYEDFQKNLKRLRKIARVTTITMHSTPRSKFDSRDLWRKYSYRRLGIKGEPWFDVDQSKVLWLTDTGRRWRGVNYNNSVSNINNANKGNRLNSVPNPDLIKKGTRICSTDQLIRAVRRKALPDQIMLTIQPQRWHHHKILWFGELVSQNVKHMVRGAGLASSYVHNLVTKQNTGITK